MRAWRGNGRRAGGEHAAPRGADGKPLTASEPVLVNPTASISGLLDKMAATGGRGARWGGRWPSGSGWRATANPPSR